MADNTTLNPGTGGDTIREVDKAGAKTQVILVDIGGLGVESLFTGAITVTSGTISLPSGASTAARQDTGNTSLSSIDGKITAVNTGAVVVSSSALPSGASTSALQTTGNSSLSSIDTKTPALGQALAAASSPVVLTAAQIATLTPPAAITGFALEAGHLATIDTSTAKIPSQGQALAAASMPVVLTAIQQAALTPPAAITGFALEAGHLATIDTKTPSLGQALAASSVPVVLTAAQLSTLTPLATVAVTAASLPLPANAAQETGGNLAALNTVIGTTADVVKRPDETGSIEARLLYLSEQMADLIDVQKTSQELLFRNLIALEAISRQQPYEVN